MKLQTAKAIQKLATKVAKQSVGKSYPVYAYEVKVPKVLKEEMEK
jgi:hypothetical protein